MSVDDPFPLPGVIVEPGGFPVSVTITSPSGTAPNVYSDAFGISLLTMPKTITARTTFYVAGEGPWVVNGVTVGLDDNQVGTVNLTPAAPTSITLNVKTYGAVGDGVTDDRTAIQAAINAANVLYTNTGAPVTVTGVPGATYFCTYQGVTEPTYGTQAAFPSLFMQSGVVLSGLSLLFPDYAGVLVCGIGDNGNAGPQLSNWQVVNCTLNGQAPASANVEQIHEGILFGNSTNVWIRNNTIKNWRQNAIETITVTTAGTQVQHCWIDSNFITTCLGGACRIHGGQDLWITNNVAWECLNATYAQTAAPNCITLSGSYTHQGVKITGNRVYDWGLSYDLDGNCSDVIFDGNYGRCPSGGKGNGLQISGGGSLTRTIVANNVFDMSLATTGAFAAGINSNALCTDVVFKGNQIIMGAQSQNAISIANTAGSERVQIVDNQIDGVTAVHDAVINLTNTTDCIIARNHIDASAYSGTGLLGIWVQSTNARVTVSDNYVVNPYIRVDIACLVNNNTVVNVGTANPAISCQASGVTVVGNNLTSAAYGVLTPGSVTNCTVVGNSITCTTGGNNIIFQGGASIATGNTLINNGSGNTFREVSASGNLIVGNLFGGTQTSYLSMLSPSTTAVRDNIGPNPIGVVVVGVPSTTNSVTAVHYDRTFYITNGTAALTLAIQNGPSIVVPASALGTVRLPAGKTMSYTYASGTPTQVVEGE